jgi:hypothetical protein
VQREEIYNDIVTAFSQKYDWLGRQYAEEFLNTAASYNIQKYSNPEFRVRRHLMLCWSAAWLKSSLLKRTYEILGSGLCTLMTDITRAALRGTVEAGQFISPFTLKRPFSICTEFGQIISGSDTGELTQELLNVLEEGLLNVSLGKISYLSAASREDAANKYGIEFLDNNTFTYSTNWILLASTYNRKFLVDNALESRFTIVYPEKKLDNALTKHLVEAGPFTLNTETVLAFRQLLLDDKGIDTREKLPHEAYEDEHPLTPRDSGAILSWMLCRKWWGFKTSKDEVLQIIEQIRSRRENLWKTADDKVFDAIESLAKTAEQIAKETDLTKRQVYYSLRNIRASRIIDEEGIAKWRLL